MKNNLNGHYCLATKAHYDKLVEDGVKLPDNFNHFKHSKYFEVLFNSHHKEEVCIYQTDYPDGTSKPMHLHNNVWIFGTLEHEEKLYSKHEGMEQLEANINAELEQVKNKENYPLEKDMGKEVDKLPIKRITMLDHADSIHTAMTTPSKDWSLNNKDAWIYGIIVGWGNESLKELSLKHRWHNGTIERLKKLHAEYLEANQKDK